MWALQAAVLAVALSSAHALCTRGNLALKKNTAQSSTYLLNKVPLSASYAVDGDLQNRISTKPNEKCTHTLNNNRPWWRVDLGATYRIGTIVITNRGDCCGNRLNNFQILIGNTLDDKNGGAANAPIQTGNGATYFGAQSQGKAKAYYANGQAGRYIYIKVFQNNIPLTLCEVEVSEYCPDNCFNLALNQQASASSVGWGGLPSYAVDGDRDNNHQARSCYHSAWQSNVWWRVDLGASRQISRVRITNRGDCCSSRINGFQIRLGNYGTPGQYQCNTARGLQTITGGATNDFDCSQLGVENSVSRYVYILIPGSNKLLQLCEVEVFEKCDYTPYKVNLARGKRAWQNSYCCGGTAGRAVDGNRNNQWRGNSCTHTGRQGTTWWTVDLGREYDINQVGIMNRGDCCGNRLSNFAIRIGNRIDNNGATNPVCRSGQSLNQGQWMIYPCAYMRGRYVSIYKYNNDYLTLCEVEVYGQSAPNDALGKNVSSNADNPANPATNAVDGGTDQRTTMKSCTITKAVLNPYISVDLGEIRYVTSINFAFPSGGTYRTDIKNKAVVFVTNDATTLTGHRSCGNFSSYDGKASSFNLNCNNGATLISGRYVVILLAGVTKSLGVCEMDVVSQKMITCNVPGRYGAWCRSTCPAGTGGYQCQKCPGGRAGQVYLFSTNPRVCIRPTGGQLYPNPGTVLEFTTNCSESSSLFTVVPHGPIQHVYSGLCIFPQNGQNGGGSAPPAGSNVILSNQCTHPASQINVDQVTGVTNLEAYPTVCISPTQKGVPKNGAPVTFSTCAPQVGVLRAWDIDPTIVNTWTVALNIRTNDARFAYSSSYWGNPKFFGDQNNPLASNSWLSAYSNVAITAFSVQIGAKVQNYTLPRAMRGIYTLQELVLKGGIELFNSESSGLVNPFQIKYPSAMINTAYCTNFGFGPRFFTGASGTRACQGLARIGVTTGEKTAYGSIMVFNRRCLHISGGGFRKVGKRNLVTWSGCDDSSRRLYFYIDTQGRWRQSRLGVCITTNSGKATLGQSIVTNDNCDPKLLFPWEYDPSSLLIRPKGSKLCVASRNANPGNGNTLFLTSKCSATSSTQYLTQMMLFRSPYNRLSTNCQQNKPTSAEGIGLTSGCVKMTSAASGLISGSSVSFQTARVYVLGHKRCDNGASCNPFVGTCDCAAGFAGVSCDLPCPTGRYGLGCRQLCNCSNGGKCNPVNGQCTCTAGWTGPRCITPCPANTTGVGCQPCQCFRQGAASCDRFNGSCQCFPGYGGTGCSFMCNDQSSSGQTSLRNKWGPGCIFNCRCSINSVCNGKDGSCACNPGYRGTLCGQTCSKGFYGAGCTQVCTCQNGAACDPVTGACTCTSGYYGSECQFQCSFSQPNYQCGIACKQKCKCDPNNGICDPSSCGCQACRPGYRGSLCTSKCAPGTWGDKCAKKCTCKNRALCNNVDGTCTCAPGWMGTNCNTRCPSDKWGSGCTNKCLCQHGKCNRVDGTCSCDPGYTGLVCDGKCKNGYYGQGCKASCGCDARYVQDPNNMCDAVTGKCSCIAGYTGRCDTTCKPFFYGATCTQKCNCNTKNSIGCNQRTGACDCMPGFGGSDCGTPCTTGRWGVDCALTCSCHSHGSTCNPVNGTCHCNAGWTGATCAFQCPNGTWGVDCANSCSCSIGGCDGVTGACQCPPGWMGSDCSQTCPTGMFGPGCTQKCSCVNGTCDKVTGTCSCFDGYTGVDCGQVCPPGKFGTGCSQSCPNCQNSQHATGSCTPHDGSCVCQPGWTGALCADNCRSGYYGPNCSMACDCNDQGPCDGVTGACMCNAGYTGETCNSTCPPNRFGQGCNSICQCFNGASCRATDGFCDCAPGYFGPNCLSACPKNHFGAHCLKNCSCASTGTCQPTDGTCICASGYTGSTCATVLSCPTGFFGPKCDGTCRCQNGTCSVIDGSCTCFGGYQGVICEEACDPGYYGAQCASQCQCKNGAICSSTDGSCACTPGWVGALCDSACADGTWGPKCQNVCACTGSKVCNKVTGECPSIVQAQGSSSSSSSSDTTKIVVPIVVVLLAILVIVLLAVWYTKRSVESKMPPGVYTAEADDITFSSPGAGGLENPTYAEASAGTINATYIPDDKVMENPMSE